MNIFRIILSCLFLFGMFGILVVNGQNKISVGLFFSAGYSYSYQSKDNQNILLAGMQPAASGGLYSYLPIAKQSSVTPFKSLKLNLELISVRSGFYEMNNNIVRLMQLSTDIGVLLPLRLKYSEDSEIYCAIGSTVGFPFRQDFKPNNLSVESNKKIQPGFTLEFGFLFTGKNLINLNVTQFGGPFPMGEVTVTFGFGGETFKKADYRSP
jgi:hypothetical protein